MQHVLMISLDMIVFVKPATHLQTAKVMWFRFFYWGYCYSIYICFRLFGLGIWIFICFIMIFDNQCLLTFRGSEWMWEQPMHEQRRMYRSNRCVWLHLWRRFYRKFVWKYEEQFHNIWFLSKMKTNFLNASDINVKYKNRKMTHQLCLYRCSFLIQNIILISITILR